MDVAIPRVDMPCVRGRDPYEFVYAPYVPDAKAQRMYEVHGETGTLLGEEHAVKLLKEIIEAPVDHVARGAGVNLDRLRHQKLIVRWTAGHNNRLRAELEEAWAKSLRCAWRQPIHLIKDYFGERVAFYFAFLGFYTWWLVAPALVGLGIFIDQVRAGTPSVSYLPVYGIFTAMWSTFFLEVSGARKGRRWRETVLCGERAARLTWVVHLALPVSHQSTTPIRPPRQRPRSSGSAARAPRP
jgi:hypothetical protein